MTYLAILDQSPTASAHFTADSHLNHSITLCAQLVSTAAQERMLPGELVILKDPNGVRRYTTKGINGELLTLLPPLQDPAFRPWIDWLKAEYQRVWWMVTTCWFLDKELAFRFGSIPQHQDHLRLQAWVVAGLTRVFSKNKLPVGDYPVVVPPGAMGTGILAYRDYYKGLLEDSGKGRGRMKWTARDIPDFVGGYKVVTKEPPVEGVGVHCEVCAPTGEKVACPPKTGCGLADCPWRDEELCLTCGCRSCGTKDCKDRT